MQNEIRTGIELNAFGKFVPYINIRPSVGGLEKADEFSPKFLREIRRKVCTEESEGNDLSLEFDILFNLFTVSVVLPPISPLDTTSPNSFSSRRGTKFWN